MAYDATPTAARALTAVRGSEALRAAWSVFWTTRAAVLVVAVFAARPLGRRLVPAHRRVRLRRERRSRGVLPALSAAGAGGRLAIRRLAGGPARGRVRGAPRGVPRGARAAPPAGLARARPAAGAARAAAARRVPGGRLLRRSVLGEPLPAARRGGVLRRPHRPLGLGGRRGGGGGRHVERRRPPAAAAGDALVELAAKESSRRRLARARPAGHRRLRRVPRPLRGRRLALPRRAGRVVARADPPPGRRVGRARRGRRRRAPAAVGAARRRVLRAGRRRPVPHRRHQPHAVRLARVRGGGVRRLFPPPAEGLRRVGGRVARAAADLPREAAAADVPATLPRRAVPDLHVAGGVVRGAPGHGACGGGVRARAWAVPGAVRQLALDLGRYQRGAPGRAGRLRPSAILLDALGTLVELQPPAPRLRARLAEDGYEVSEERGAAGGGARDAGFPGDPP